MFGTALTDVATRVGTCWIMPAILAMSCGLLGMSSSLSSCAGVSTLPSSAPPTYSVSRLSFFAFFWKACGGWSEDKIGKMKRHSECKFNSVSRLSFLAFFWKACFFWPEDKKAFSLQVFFVSRLPFWKACVVAGRGRR